MSDRIAALDKAIKANRGYLAKKDALVYHEKIRRYTAERDALVRAEEAEAEADSAAAWSGTYDEAYARWLDAADEALKAAGKPYGRDGAERGALDRAESIEIAKAIGVFDELGGENGIWGPPPGPGVIA